MATAIASDSVCDRLISHSTSPISSANAFAAPCNVSRGRRRGPSTRTSISIQRISPIPVPKGLADSFLGSEACGQAVRLVATVFSFSRSEESLQESLAQSLNAISDALRFDHVDTTANHSLLPVLFHKAAIVQHETRRACMKSASANTSFQYNGIIKRSRVFERSMVNYKFLAPFTLLLALVLAACGGGEDSTPQPTPMQLQRASFVNSRLSPGFALHFPVGWRYQVTETGIMLSNHPDLLTAEDDGATIPSGALAANVSLLTGSRSTRHRRAQCCRVD